jgi:hypothetical protein
MGSLRNRTETGNLTPKKRLIQNHNGKSCLASDLSTHDDDGNALQPDDSKIL